jgi:YegS/Rv2252/BmrU family lipid kinase
VNNAPAPENIKIIVNPVSGLSGKREKFLSWLRKASTIPGENIFYTEYPGHAAELASRLAGMGAEAVFALGGDGTANEVASGLIGSETVFGVIPSGSGNGIAHMLKIPDDIEKIFAGLSNAEVRKIDVGGVLDRIFLATSGIGFSADVAWDFSRFGRRGALPYFWLAARKYFASEQKKVRILTPDSDFTAELFEFTIANGPEFGNGALIAPEASLDDGKLDVVFFPKPSMHTAAAFGLRLFAGSLTRHPDVSHFRSESVTVISDEKIAFIHVDGDPVPLDGNEIHWKILPSRLKVFSF